MAGNASEDEIFAPDRFAGAERPRLHAISERDDAAEAADIVPTVPSGPLSASQVLGLIRNAGGTGKTDVLDRVLESVPAEQRGAILVDSLGAIVTSTNPVNQAQATARIVEVVVDKLRPLYVQGALDQLQVAQTKAALAKLDRAQLFDLDVLEAQKTLEVVKAERASEVGILQAASDAQVQTDAIARDTTHKLTENQLKDKDRELSRQMRRAEQAAKESTAPRAQEVLKRAESASVTQQEAKVTIAEAEALRATTRAQRDVAKAKVDKNMHWIALVMVLVASAVIVTFMLAR